MIDHKLVEIHHCTTMWTVDAGIRYVWGGGFYFERMSNYLNDFNSIVERSIQLHWSCDSQLFSFHLCIHKSKLRRKPCSKALTFHCPRLAKSLTFYQTHTRYTVQRLNFELNICLPLILNYFIHTKNIYLILTSTAHVHCTAQTNDI